MEEEVRIKYTKDGLEHVLITLTKWGMRRKLKKLGLDKCSTFKSERAHLDMYRGEDANHWDTVKRILDPVMEGSVIVCKDRKFTRIEL